LNALRQYGISGARRQPSETAHAMVLQKKAPRERPLCNSGVVPPGERSHK